MAKYPAFIFAVLLFFSTCLADTFVHRQTGETFNGYYLQEKEDGKTQVRVDKKGMRYLDLGAYKIERNSLGRKNEVFIFSITDSINLICETEAFEQAITLAADKGPLFILIEINTPGGRIDLAHRICSAITAVDNCTTIAFVTGDQFGGAFSQGAAIALACDKLYLRKGAAIGATPLYAEKMLFSPETTEEASYSGDVAEELDSAWLAYCAEVAKRNNRPEMLVKAMLDEDIEVAEITGNDKRLFIDPSTKEPSQVVVRTWSKKGSLLTLTAADAVLSGIADGIVASREELLANFDAAKAEQVRDTRVLRARRDFQRAQNKMDRMLTVIEELNLQADNMVADVNTLDKEIDRNTELFYRRRYGPWLPYRGPGLYELDRMLVARDELLARLVLVLENLRGNCERALSLAEDQPDLRQKAQTVEESLESAEAIYREIRPRLYYYGPRYYRRRR